jgi:hypothetical protein
MKLANLMTRCDHSTLKELARLRLGVGVMEGEISLASAAVHLNGFCCDKENINYVYFDGCARLCFREAYQQGDLYLYLVAELWIS